MAREGLHNLVSSILESPLPFSERLRLLFEAYERAPDYVFLMHLGLEYSSLAEKERAQIIETYRHYLTLNDDRLVEPIEYSLWCDYFEDPATVERFWRVLATPGAEPAVLRRLLRIAGPVPWNLKANLLRDLARSRKWHPYIYRCLLHSCRDYFGKIVPDEALRVLNGLSLAPDTEHLEDLRRRLREGKCR